MTAEVDDPRTTFIDAAFWHGSKERADAILKAHPAIAGRDIYMAATLGDADAVRRFIAPTIPPAQRRRVARGTSMR